MSLPVTEIKSEPEEYDDEPLVYELAPPRYKMDVEISDPLKEEIKEEPPDDNDNHNDDYFDVALEPKVEFKDFAEIKKEEVVEVTPSISPQLLYESYLADVTKSKMVTHESLGGGNSERVMANLVCSFCTLTFDKIGRLRLHIRRQHRDLHNEHFEHQCSFCHLAYDRLESLKKHVIRHHKSNAKTYHCEKCGKVFKDKFKYLHHHDDNLLECDICGMMYATAAMLRRHRRSVHKLEIGVKKYICPDCGEGFEQKRSLNMHFSRLHSNVKYSCLICPAEFKLRESLRRHVHRKHNVSSLYTCSHCKETFKSTEDLTSHVTNTHQDIANNEVGEIKPKMFNCRKCEKIFDSPVILQRHVNRTHRFGQITKSKQDGNKPSQCQYCGKVFKEKYLNKHLRLRHPANGTTSPISYSCDYCDFKTKQKGNLKTHSRMHTKEKPYACSVDGCDYRAAYASSIYIHKLIHNKDRNMLQCSQCTFRTVNKYLLRRHEKEHLYGKRKYNCPECSYSTYCQSNLSQHKQKHSQIKSYKCDQCSFASKYNVSVKHHKKRKHPSPSDDGLIDLVTKEPLVIHRMGLENRVPSPPNDGLIDLVNKEPLVILRTGLENQDE